MHTRKLLRHSNQMAHYCGQYADIYHRNMNKMKKKKAANLTHALAARCFGINTNTNRSVRMLFHTATVCVIASPVASIETFLHG